MLGYEKMCVDRKLDGMNIWNLATKGKKGRREIFFGMTYYKILLLKLKLDPSWNQLPTFYTHTCLNLRKMRLVLQNLTRTKVRT